MVTSRTYRADVDGLRAVAVLSIVLFHFGVSAMSGGFVGVDVFFVISGYLITRIILRELSAGEFNLAGFYMRRIRRIGPALLAVLALTLVGGLFILPPAYYIELGDSTVAALFSVSNILFWMQAGYFDTEAVFKPLLHTWSLGVEEQFYIFWPLLMLFCFNRLFERGRLFLLMAGLGLVSVVAAEYTLSHNPSTAFFLMPFRIAEFCLGAGLALFPTRKPRIVQGHALSVTGLALIAIPVFAYGEHTRFPGLFALVPCLGASLLIASGPTAIVNRLLSVAPVVYVGRISYSLYLVHWPLVSFHVFWFQTLPTGHSTLYLLAASLVLASLLFHLVETPFRRKRDGIDLLSGKSVRRVLGAAAVGIIGASIGIGASGGYPGRMPEGIRDFNEAMSDARRERGNAIRRPQCHFRSNAPDIYFSTFPDCNSFAAEGNVVILGDSHAAGLWYAATTAQPDRNFIQLTGAGCGLDDLSKNENGCRPFLENSLQFIRENSQRISLVVYTQWASSMMERDATTGDPIQPIPSVEATVIDRLAELRAEGLPIVFLGPRAELRPRLDVRSARARSLRALRESLSSVDYTLYRDLDTRLAAMSADRAVPYLSSYATFCRGDTCEMIDVEGRPMIVDHSHWSPVVSAVFWERLLAAYPALRRGDLR